MLKKTILIVDDEKDTLAVLEKRLAMAGFEILLAQRGATAIEIAISKKPDLIVLDINMPGMDGGEVAHQLGENPSTSKIPIIYLTCLVSEKEGPYVKDSKGHLMIPKNADTNLLIEKITEEFAGNYAKS